jgi:hypothetical protein
MADSGPMADAAVRPDAGPCPSTLAERLEVTPVDVAPAQVALQAGGYFSRDTPPILSPAGANRSWVAWGDSGGTIHVTPLDALDNRSAVDVTLPGNELRGLAAHDAGFAVLVQRGSDVMALVGHDASGSQTFDVEVVGNTDHGVEGAKYIRRDWGDNGRAAWTGTSYVVYFGHTMNWGAQGEHQGDLLWTYDLAGAQQGGGWDWGCSHSLDVRLAVSGSTVGPVCLSDCYPTKAIHFDHNTLVWDEPSGNCSGSSSGELGGLTAVPGGFALTFVTGEGRSSRDVGLVPIINGTVGQVTWLTDTAGTDESASQVARYGDDLFVTWRAGSDRLAAVVSTSGSMLMGPESIPAEAGLATDLIQFSSGDVGWAYAWQDLSELKIVRVRLCQ